jgi:DNA-binding CsgD family transcriptional regulator
VTRLRASDLEALLAVVADAHSIDGTEAFPPEFLGRLAELVPCEGVFFNERDVVRRRLIAEAAWYAEDTESCSEPPTEDEWSLIARNPLKVYCRRTGDFGVRKLSDFYTRRQRVSRAVFPDYLAAVHTVDSIGVRLRRSHTYTVSVGFESQRRDFGERDRLVLQLLSPHLAAAFRHAQVRRLLSSALVALDSGTEVGMPGVVLLLGRNRIEFVSRSARRLLESYFDHHGRRLPGEVDSWLRSASARDRPFTKLRDGRRLVVDAHPGDRSVLLLREGPDTAALTPREWDVLRCVGAGMSNAETARFLWVSSATVRKHLENTYAKLGVRSRTAALAKVAPSLGVRDPISVA